MKDIKNYEGLYAVTEDGRVWSYRRKKFLKPSGDKNGYLVVNLCRNGEQVQYKVHRLIAEAFISNPDSLSEVNHINEDKTDNRVINLQWISHGDNVNYGTRTERATKSLSKAIFCIELNKIFESINAAARELKINAGNLTACLKGRQHTCGGYHWQYAEEVK